MTNYLTKRWIESGLRKNDNILLHSSFKRTLKELKNHNYNVGPQDLLESLIDLVLPNGNLLIPTFNFDFNDGVDYDYYKTKSQMGVVTEYARKHVKAKRTLNPVYSFAAFGNDAHLFDNLDNKSWYSNESPFGIVHKMNYKICIIDLRDRNSMTFAHYCEEYFQVPWKFYKNFTGNYKDKNGNSTIKTYKGYVRKINEGIDTTLDPAGELLWERNLYKGNKINEGNGLRFVYANDYFDFFKELYEQNKCKPYFYDKIT